MWPEKTFHFSLLPSRRLQIPSGMKKGHQLWMHTLNYTKRMKECECGYVLEGCEVILV